MHSMGLEPTPGNPDMNLNHARMPIPPQVHFAKINLQRLILYQEKNNKSITFYKKLKRIVNSKFYFNLMEGNEKFSLIKTEDVFIIYLYRFGCLIF